MKILIAPDSFKGSLTAQEICEIGKEAILNIDKKARVIAIPLADGGEGTVEALVFNTGGTIIKCYVKGPFGQRVEAQYGILGDKETAVIEMASASGIILQDRRSLDPLVATSYGTGELIQDAIKNGCSKIIMGIGGSATNDGGLGMLKALGFRFLDDNEVAVNEGGQNLIKIKTVDSTGVDQAVLKTTFRVACDVDNPLCGPKGATMTYGPQKGGTESTLAILEEGMEHFGRITELYSGKKVMTYPGAGAAGGMGAGLLGYLDTTLSSGFGIISESIGLEEIVARGNFDLIITGEGQMNHQTLNGKLPFGVARIGKKYKVPVVALVGALGEGYEAMYDEGLTAAFSIVNGPMSLDEAMADAKRLLYNCIYNIISTTTMV